MNDLRVVVDLGHCIAIVNAHPKHDTVCLQLLDPGDTETISGSVSAYLKAEAVREIAHALLLAVGDVIPTPQDPGPKAKGVLSLLPNRKT